MRAAGLRGHPASRRIIRSIKASRPDHRRRTRQGGPYRGGGDDRTGRPPRRPRGDHRDRGQPGHRRTLGFRPRRLPSAGNVTVALAAGKAFSFGYAEHRELLVGAGAEVAEFDPLTEPLPPQTAALVLPGGFPEQFSTELSSNEAVRQQIRRTRRVRCTRARRMRRPGLSGRRTRRASDVRRVVRVGTFHRSPHTGLPQRGRGGRFVAVRDRRPYGRVTSSTAPQCDSPKTIGLPGCTAAALCGAARDGAVDAGVHASYLHTHPAAHPDAIDPLRAGRRNL